VSSRLLAAARAAISALLLLAWYEAWRRWFFWSSRRRLGRTLSRGGLPPGLVSELLAEYSAALPRLLPGVLEILRGRV
jgi:hypothetical protein